MLVIFQVFLSLLFLNNGSSGISSGYVSDSILTDTTIMQDNRKRIPFSYENAKEYMFENLKYPKEAIENDIEGTVFVRFTITPSGDLDSIRIVKNVHPLLDNEALRLIRHMPLWEPVYYQGEPTSISYEIPVIFEILRSDSIK